MTDVSVKYTLVTTIIGVNLSNYECSVFWYGSIRAECFHGHFHSLDGAMTLFKIISYKLIITK